MANLIVSYHRIKEEIRKNTQFFLILVSLFFPTRLLAQQANTFYLLHDVPQSSFLNPAIRAECKLVVGLPMLGTIHAEYNNSSFTYDEFARGNNFLFEEVYEGLTRMNLVSTGFETYPVALGYTWNNQYFTFHVADRFSTYATYSRKLAGLLIYGNAQFVGDPQRLRNTRLNSTYIREYALGWAYDFDRFMALGIRAKLLFGKANLSTASSRILFGTDPETFDLTVDGNVRLNSSMPISISQRDNGAISNISLLEQSYFSFFMNPRNVGLGLDLGVSRKYNPLWTFHASLLDLGFLIWSSNTYNVQAEVEFLYEGVSEGTDFSTAAYFRDLSDSLSSDIIYNVTEKAYLYALPTQLFLAAEYQWKKNATLGIVMRNQFVNRRLVPSITGSVNGYFYDRFQASLSWSYLNNSLKNIGGAIAYTGRGLQFFMVSDNIIGLIDPVNSRTINLRFGMNLLLGCPKSFYNSRKEERSMLPCPPGRKGKGRQ